MKFADSIKSFTLASITKNIDLYHIRRQLSDIVYEKYNKKLGSIINVNNSIRSKEYYQKETDRIPYIKMDNIQDTLLYALCILEMKHIDFVPGIKNHDLKSKQIVEYILKYDPNMEIINNKNRNFYWKTYVIVCTAMALCFKIPHLKILDILGECKDDTIDSLKKAIAISQDIIRDDMASSNNTCASKLFVFLDDTIISRSVAF